MRVAARPAVGWVRAFSRSSPDCLARPRAKTAAGPNSHPASKQDNHHGEGSAGGHRRSRGRRGRDRPPAAGRRRLAASSLLAANTRRGRAGSVSVCGLLPMVGTVV